MAMLTSIPVAQGRRRKLFNGEVDRFENLRMFIRNVTMKISREGSHGHPCEIYAPWFEAIVTSRIPLLILIFVVEAENTEKKLINTPAEQKETCCYLQEISRFYFSQFRVALTR